MTSVPPPPPPAVPSGLPGGHRLVRLDDPQAALGLAVARLMGKPGFADLRFGAFARVLAGQVNRGQHLFLMRGGSVVGFVGWSRAAPATAEAWLRGQAGPGPDEALHGACVIVNAWQADDAPAQQALVAAMRQVWAGVPAIYGRRSYGPSRPPRPVRVVLRGG